MGRWDVITFKIRNHKQHWKHLWDLGECCANDLRRGSTAPSHNQALWNAVIEGMPCQRMQWFLEPVYRSSHIRRERMDVIRSCYYSVKLRTCLLVFVTPIDGPGIISIGFYLRLLLRKCSMNWELWIRVYVSYDTYFAKGALNHHLNQIALETDWQFDMQSLL